MYHMMPPQTLPFHSRTYFVWKSNICFMRAKDHYNLAAIGNISPDLTMGKKRGGSQRGNQKAPGAYFSVTYYELDSSTIMPSGGQEDSKCSCSENWKRLLRPLHLPAVVLCHNCRSSVSLQSGGIAGDEPDTHLRCVSFWLRTHS